MVPLNLKYSTQSTKILFSFNTTSFLNNQLNIIIKLFIFSKYYRLKRESEPKLAFFTLVIKRN